jgi:hypothetical protein
MLIKTTMALAVILGTASGALAATKTHSINPAHDVYNSRGMYVGALGALAATKTHSTNPAHDVYDSSGRYVSSDPDPAIRFELRRDWAYGPRN